MMLKFVCTDQTIYQQQQKQQSKKMPMKSNNQQFNDSKMVEKEGTM